MPAKKTEEVGSFAHKVKVIEKLFAANCKTEKELQSLDMEKILKIPGISIPDMTVIMELQKQVKAGKLYTYLGGENDEQPKQNE